MQSEIQAFFEEEVRAFTQRLAALEKECQGAGEPQADSRLDELTDAIAASRAACRELGVGLADQPELLREVQAMFREQIRPWFDQSWFMERGRSKPRGYPGDHELLSAIYADRPRSPGLGGWLDLYFLRTDLARAVVGRLHSVRAFLQSEIAARSEPISILNVACGPCREYQDFGLPLGAQVQLTCVDHDQECLDYIAQYVRPQAPAGLNIECTAYNALRMSSTKNNLARFGRNDIIYSVGLCDYIPDRLLVPMMRGWRESLAPGGQVYIAFKDCERYDCTEYQWHVDWHFFQRTEADCRRLFEEAGFAMDRLQVSRDESGVILNFIGRNPGEAILRVDPAESSIDLHVSRPAVESRVAARPAVSDVEPR